MKTEVWFGYDVVLAFVTCKNLLSQQVVSPVSACRWLLHCQLQL